MEPPTFKPLLLIHCCPRDVPEQLDWCLANARQCHPSIPAVLISDGIAAWHVRISNKHGVHHVCGEHLKNIRRGTEWVIRMLKIGIAFAEETGCTHIWKIDPDTHVVRPFSTPPSAADCFGHIHDNPIPHVQGGSMFLSVEAAKACLRDLVDCREFDRSGFWLPVTLPPKVISWATRTGWLSSDFVTLKLLERCGLPIGDWEEVFSVCNSTRVPNDLTSYAIVHPVRI